MNTATAIDPKAYKKELSRFQPRPIRNDKELKAVTKQLLEFDKLMDKRDLTPEETEIEELLTVLVEAYESSNRTPRIRGGKPHENLASVLEHRGKSQTDLAKIIGSRSHASEILSGKREISKILAKKLAEEFRAPVELFI